MPDTYIKKKELFHLGLCMAGSISAGAYIAGVVDYLAEALENWEKARRAGDPTVPDHQVVIDLMGGSSGGGITSAISYFALRDQLQHAFVASDGKTVTADPGKNILWKIWVELNDSKQGLLIDQLLSPSDIGDKYVASALNTSFIDDLVKSVEQYIGALAQKTSTRQPNYLNPEMELFISLFNITGIKYKLFNKANTPANQQSFFSEHRDLVHFRWQSKYEGDGRIPLDFTQLNKNLPIMLAAAKATSAFPVGLRAVIMRRPAKYIWDNPFFGYGKFGKETIHLGDCRDDNDIYVSLHSDSGVANNEPVELSRDLLYMIHERFYKKEKTNLFAEMNEIEQAMVKSTLYNASVIMIDPFPATDFTIDKPGSKDDNLVDLAGKIVNAMNSQLLFDAKQALNAYNKNDYGLSIIAPSKSGLTSDDAIACGSLGGFGGFLSKEFRIHDFFLGRHNCQSFLRKYYVVDLNEQEGSANYHCVASVINAYKNNPAAVERFGFTAKEKTTEKNLEKVETKHWVPIIPEVTLKEKIVVTYKDEEPVFTDIDPLPLYAISPLPENFLDGHEKLIKDRLVKVITNLFDKGWQLDLYVKLGALLSSSRITEELINTIKKDFQKRNLMDK